VIADILPPPVAAAQAFGDPPDAELYPLYPGEEAVIAHAVDNRRREFATGRACARAALAQLGVPGAAILPGTRGAPQWPAGVVGSITHCAGYRACAVAFGRDVVAIGVDAEPDRELRDGVLKAVAGEAEEARIRTLRALRALRAAIPEVCWDRLLFSAKESVYKAWFPLVTTPLTGRRLRLRDARVDFDPGRATFSARLLVDGPGGARRAGRPLGCR
jgi:4'-phosphopantetheinyl transferase EntD